MDYFPKEKREKYFPNCYMIPPMLAWKLPKNKQNKREEVFTSGEYFAEVKIDGSCYTFEHTLEGEVYLFSRTISTKNGLLVEKSDRVPHLVEVLKNILPPGTVIALEIYKPGGKSKDITTIMGCLPLKAIARQEKLGKLHAYIHDILVLKNESTMDIPAIGRLEILANIINEESEYIKVAFPILHYIDEYLEKVWQQGYEGIILKGMDSKYSPGKRPAWSWIKFKPEDTHDVIALSFNSPTKEYTGKEIDNWKYWENEIPVTKSYANGWIGSINMGVYKDGKIFPIGSVASGLTEKTLAAIKQSPNDYINKPMEVKAMETTSDFKLREPKFIKFREDINTENCNFNKIFT